MVNYLILTITIPHVGHNCVLFSLFWEIASMINLVDVVKSKLMRDVVLSIAFSWTGEELCGNIARKHVGSKGLRCICCRIL